MEGTFSENKRITAGYIPIAIRNIGYKKYFDYVPTYSIEPESIIHQVAVMQTCLSSCNHSVSTIAINCLHNVNITYKRPSIKYVTLANNVYIPPFGTLRKHGMNVSQVTFILTKILSLPSIYLLCPLRSCF